MATYTGTMSAHIVDQYGIPGEAQVIIELDGTKTLDQLAADVAAYNLVVQPLTQGINPETQVRINFEGASVTGAAGDIEKGSLWNFDNASDSYAQGVYVPDIQPAILNTSGLIDLTNTDVTNWITYLTTAHTVITVVTKGIRALTSLRDALISFRKHRKPLSRKTKEV